MKILQVFPEVFSEILFELFAAGARIQVVMKG